MLHGLPNVHDDYIRRPDILQRHKGVYKLQPLSINDFRMGKAGYKGDNRQC